MLQKEYFLLKINTVHNITVGSLFFLSYFSFINFLKKKNYSSHCMFVIFILLSFPNGIFAMVMFPYNFIAYFIVFIITME